MNRIRRGMFNFLSALSAVALVAVLALWATSYWWMFQVSHATPSGTGVTATTSFYAVNGGVQFWRLVGMEIGAERGISFSMFDVSQVSTITPGRALWFFDASSTRKTHFGVPGWAIVAVLAVLPIFRLREWRRVRGRIVGHHCLHCGYDLRASPIRCPECSSISAEHAVAYPTNPVDRTDGRNGD